MDTRVQELLDMLTYCRPAGSPTERAFIARYIRPLPGAIQDMCGNWHVEQGDQRVLWSAHTDTVHKLEGRQTVRYNPATMIAQLSRRSKRQGRNCLGADDTAGVFILCEMIRAGIPGHYVFHYAEERGGIGSNGLAKHAPDLVSNSDIAIAFDRRGGSDVITSQYGSRCASDTFALSLAAEIARVNPRLDYASASGVYTDTAEYMHLIPECTNLSVGYLHEHSDRECLYIWHTLQLLDAMLHLDTDRLIVEREPKVDDWQGDYLPSWYRVADLADEKDAYAADDIYLDRVYADIQKALGRKDNC
jgi:hypothetical protein